MRYYTPEMGRWVDRDSKGEAGGTNVNQFLLNAPNMFVDPTGETPVSPNPIPITINPPTAAMLADCAADCGSQNFWAFVTNWGTNAFSSYALGLHIAADCAGTGQTEGEISNVTYFDSPGTTLGACMLTCMFNKVVSLPPRESGPITTRQKSKATTTRRSGGGVSAML